MKKITVKPEMLEVQGLEIDMHDIAGWIDLTTMIEIEPNLILEDIQENEDLDLSGKQWDKLLTRIIGDDLDPYAITDFERLIPDVLEYVIEEFLNVTELHGVIDLVPRDPRLSTREQLFCMGLDPFTVELWAKPYDLYKVWIDEVGGSVEIGRAFHAAYTEDQAVTLEVIKEIFESKNNAIGNSCLTESFDANNSVGDYMHLDRYDLLKEIVTPDWV